VITTIVNSQGFGGKNGAMKLAVWAGRIAKKLYASASSPVEGLVGR
jgi:hypothetical protein